VSSTLTTVSVAAAATAAAKARASGAGGQAYQYHNANSAGSNAAISSAAGGAAGQPGSNAATLPKAAGRGRAAVALNAAQLQQHQQALGAILNHRRRHKTVHFGEGLAAAQAQLHKQQRLLEMERRRQEENSPRAVNQLFNFIENVLSSWAAEEAEAQRRAASGTTTPAGRRSRQGDRGQVRLNARHNARPLFSTPA